MDDPLENSMDKLEISGSGTFGTDSELEDSLDSLFGQVNQQQNTRQTKKLEFAHRMNRSPALQERSSAAQNLRMGRGVNAMTQMSQPVTEPTKRKKGKRIRKDDGKYSDTKYATADVSFRAKNSISKSTSTAAASSSSSKGRASRNAGAWISSSMEIKSKIGSPISTAGKGYSGGKSDISSSKTGKSNESATQTAAAASRASRGRSKARERGARLMNKSHSAALVDSSKPRGADSKDQKGKWDSGDQRQRNMRQELLRNELGLGSPRSPSESRPRGADKKATRAVFFM